MPVKPPLPRLAPTGLHSFAECHLHGVWTASRQPVLLPSSPAARLGTIVHRLLEDAGRGSLSAGTESIQKRWQELVGAAETAMSKSVLERRFVPLQQAVPQFDVIRIRAEQRASELSRDIPGAQMRGGDARSSPFGCELHVQSIDGLIAGRIDRVLATNEGPVLQ